MSFYENRILPHLIDCSCSLRPIMKQRREVVPKARGTVLEVGMGSGINLALYDPEQVELVYGLEPSQGMRRKARRNLAQAPVKVEWLELPGEQLPLDDESVDTIVLTFTLCTIPDCHKALRQMRRVLKPSGELLFLEHGAAPDEKVARWQRRVTPYWKKIAGGCHLDRPISRMIADSGFRLTAEENLYMPRTPKFAGYIYRGSASRGEEL